MREVSVQTFTAQYDPLEDRIRLILNYADIQSRCDLWITRRFLLKILPTVEQFLYSNVPNFTTSPIIKEKAQAQANNTTSNGTVETDKNLMALTCQKGTLLSTTELSLLQSGLVKFTLIGEETKAIATLEPSRLWDIIKLIFTSVPYSEWGLSPALLA